jgi:LPPG:FO 2-phospho-L-lactate transferase
MTTERVETKVAVDGEGELAFQEYFVHRHHDVPITGVRLAGIEMARPGPGVLAAVADADRVIIGPSNPFVSIGPILAVAGVRERLAARRDSVVAVSPIVAGSALKGPAARMMTELGHDATVVGIARIYADLAATLVIDDADAQHAAAVEEAGMRCVVAPTIMHGAAEAAALAEVTLR